MSEYDNLLVFSVSNMRNTFLKQMRDANPHGRFFLAKTKLVSHALSELSQESFPNLAEVASWVNGQVGLFFWSGVSDSDVLAYFDSINEIDYARGGTKATQSITIPSGITLHYGVLSEAVDEQVDLPASMEPYLRSLSMPTILKKGKIELTRSFQVCKKGAVLTHDQAKILKVFGMKMAEFRVGVVGYWTKADDSITQLAIVGDGEQDLSDEDMSQE